MAGRPTAVAKAAEVAQEFGAKRIASLDVAGAFHTPLMSLARERLAGALDATELRIPEGTVVANVDATAHQSPETWRALMTAQLCSPVRWAQTLLTLKDLGFTTFVELGPGALQIHKKLPFGSPSGGPLGSLGALWAHFGSPLGLKLAKKTAKITKKNAKNQLKLPKIA